MSETNNTLNNENVPLIKVNDLHKSFGKHEGFKRNFDDNQKGDVVAIIGPSGCGKINISALLKPSLKAQLTDRYYLRAQILQMILSI